MLRIWIHGPETNILPGPLFPVMVAADGRVLSSYGIRQTASVSSNIMHKMRPGSTSNVGIPYIASGVWWFSFFSFFLFRGHLVDVFFFSFSGVPALVFRH